MNLIMFLCSLLFQVIFFIRVKEFRVNKLFYLLSIIIANVVMFICFEYSPLFLPLLLVIQTLLILSFIDIFYLEVDPKSYIYLIIPTIVMIFITNRFLPALFSFLFVFFVLFIMEKLNETVYNFNLRRNKDGFDLERVEDYGGIGGADIKIMLILCTWFNLMDAFSFLFVCITFTTVLYAFLALWKRKLNDIKIPMIVSISIAFIYSFFKILY